MFHRCTAYDHSLFRGQLLDWFERHARDLPWRRTRDPYLIWLSEAMLQQTRVEQATGYYLRFLERFPTLGDLAAAPLEEVLLLWEGLGYYARARNLHRAAQTILQERNGAFPTDEEAMRSLPGVGPYTTAAVLSIAYGVPLACVDGNVTRVLARYFLIEREVDAAPVRRLLAELASDLLDTARPGDFNQAVMELGATICTPQTPDCGSCPLAPGCQARKADVAESLPRKRPRKTVPHFDVGVAVLHDTVGRLLVSRRPTDVMLGGLWELPGGRAEPDEGAGQACVRSILQKLGVVVDLGERLHLVRHAYSHFKITLHAFEGFLAPKQVVSANGHGLRWIGMDQLDTLPFDRANRKLLNHLFLKV